MRALANETRTQTYKIQDLQDNGDYTTADNLIIPLRELTHSSCSSTWFNPQCTKTDIIHRGNTQKIRKNCKNTALYY